MKKKRVAILGSTGFIGINTLKVIASMPDRFEVTALSAFNNVKLFERQIREFQPRYAALSCEHVPYVKKACARRGFRVLDASSQSLAELSALKNVDIVVIAMSGAAALDPFLSAVRTGKTIAPANKEALVMAGEIIMDLARKHGARVIPVDSEQSAIFQCLQGQSSDQVLALHLTASGGALRNIPASKHNSFPVSRILAHPRWQMGNKITVDSATLMNKGLEVIEAMRLFNMPVDRIKVFVHPEAVIHSMVEFVDGSWLAQLGVTDMRLPIQYALTYPERVANSMGRLDLAGLKSLTFELPDNRAFPSLELAYYAAGKGRTWPAVLNAANEIAVDAFLKGAIRFTDIFRVVERVVLAHRGVRVPHIADIRNADAWARLKSFDFIKEKI